MVGKAMVRDGNYVGPSSGQLEVVPAMAWGSRHGQRAEPGQVSPDWGILAVFEE